MPQGMRTFFEIIITRSQRAREWRCLPFAPEGAERRECRAARLGPGIALQARLLKGRGRQSRLKMTPPSQPMVSASVTQISP